MTHIHWQRDSKTYQEHRKLIREAATWWASHHPGEPINLTEAARAFAVAKDLPPDYYQLKATTPNGLLSPTKAVKLVAERRDLICPDCGETLFFTLAPGCPTKNPKKITGIFSCGQPYVWGREDDIAPGRNRQQYIDRMEDSWKGCGYHAFTKEGIIDILNKIKAGDYAGIEKL